MDFKKIVAPQTTGTQDLSVLDSETGNIYETVRIIAKRANTIGQEMKKELTEKLENFAYCTDNLEEVFENREQIEISRFYERLPKPALIALQEFLDDNIAYTRKDEESAE